MLQYTIHTGNLFRDGLFLGQGYSGLPQYRNDPKAVSLKGHGPIPPGLYKIGPAFHHPKLGPMTMRLTPIEVPDTFQRSGFCMHGNNKANNASHGCIIMDLPIREAVDKSPGRRLKVID